MATGAGFITAIGLLADTISLVQFATSNLPSVPEAQGARVRIRAGLPENSDQNMGGTIDRIHGYNFFNQYLGSAADIVVPSGGFADAVIDQRGSETVSSTYINVVNANDGTCIAYLAVTQPDSTSRTWMGDVGYSCGANWYESAVEAGRYEDGSPYYPRCTWIDANKSFDIKYASIKVNMGSYSPSDDLNLATLDYCAGTAFSESTAANDAAKPGKRRRNAENAYPPGLNDTLVVSGISSHSAKNLCASDTSFGPDFISEVENIFCDMETHTPYPLCSNGTALNGVTSFNETASFNGTANFNETGCFDLDTESLTLRKRDNIKIKGRAVLPLEKKYKTISRW